MFLRGKWKVWTAILTLCLVYSILSRTIPDWIESKKGKEPITYTISMDTENQLLNSRIANKEITINKQPYIFINTGADPDIIITEKASEFKYHGYDKLEGYLYTSFTMFTSNHLYDGYEYWLNLVNDNGRDKYLKDLRILLEAIEKGKTWNEIGITNSRILDNENEKVRISIPNKYHYSYKYLRLYIAMALNDFQPIDSSNQDNFLTRADIILSKSKKCEVTNFIKNKDQKGILLAPESTIAECSQEFSGYGRGIIYPGTTLKIEYDVYIKPDLTDSFKSLSSEYKFLNLFGLRSANGNDISSRNTYFRRCFNVIDAVKLDSINGWQQMMKTTTGIPYSTVVAETEGKVTTTETAVQTEVEEDIKSSSENDTSTEMDENETEQQDNESMKEGNESEVLPTIDIFVVIMLCALFIGIFFIFIFMYN